MKSTVRLEEIQYVNGFGLQEYSKLASKYGANIEKKIRQALKKIGSLHTHSSKAKKVAIEVFTQKFTEKYKNCEYLAKKCYDKSLPISTSTVTDCLKMYDGL